MPADKSRYDRSFSIIEEHNQKILMQILTDPNTDKKFSTFYASCMDIDTINSLGVEPLKGYLQLVELVQDLDSLSFVTGLLHARGVGTPLFG